MSLPFWLNGYIYNKRLIWVIEKNLVKNRLMIW